MILFDTPTVYRNVRQRQFNRGLLQKRGLFGVAVKQGKRQIRSGDRQRDAGHAAATANIQQTPRRRHKRQDRQRIEQMMAHCLVLIPQGGEAVGAIPFVEQGEVGQQLFAHHGRQGQPHPGQPRIKLCRLGGHAGWRAASSAARLR